MHCDIAIHFRELELDSFFANNAIGVNITLASATPCELARTNITKVHFYLMIILSIERSFLYLGLSICPACRHISNPNGRIIFRNEHVFVSNLTHYDESKILKFLQCHEARLHIEHLLQRYVHVPVNTYDYLILL